MSASLSEETVAVRSVVPVLRPIKQGRAEWFQERLPPNYVAKMGYPIERWIHYGTDITVLTAVEVATEKDGTSNGPEYHVSVSRATWPNGRYTPARIDTNAAKWVLAEFGLDGAEEDNHVPGGVVRNFWRPVASGLVGKECRCKAEEVVIKEMKGDFIWRP